MLRTLDVILIGAMIAAATVTYQIKHRAELKLEEVRRLQAEIRLHEDTIDLLNADWSLLNQPARLDRLTKEFAEQLKLEPILPTQMAAPGELPGRAEDFAPEVPEVAGTGEGKPDDKIKTGSVTQ
jgi:hypothetical protein